MIPVSQHSNHIHGWNGTHWSYQDHPIPVSHQCECFHIVYCNFYDLYSHPQSCLSQRAVPQNWKIVEMSKTSKTLKSEICSVELGNIPFSDRQWSGLGVGSGNRILSDAPERPTLFSLIDSGCGKADYTAVKQWQDWFCLWNKLTIKCNLCK